ncbi:hypothetical protein [Streptomyces sp. NPDC005209]|uniref:hypothetical protein n=1 Tax=Streptomyces sp. NPDC005209 TaxID=3156715 RepID=UPI0033BFB276
MTDGLSLRDLGSITAHGKSQWGEYRKGRKLIPEWLLRETVEAVPVLVKDQRARQIQLNHGLKLLAAAEKAAVAREVPAVPETSASTVTELQLRLDDARRGQLQAQETLLGLNRLIYGLMHLVAHLQNRCTALEREGERALAQQRDYQQRLAQSEAALERAQRDRDKTEELRIEALRQAEENRQALDRLRTADSAPAPDGDQTDIDAGDSWPAPADLWEYDRLLQQADAQLDAHEAQMDAAREQLGIEPSDSDPDATFLTGEIVRTSSADTVDKPVTRQDSVRDETADSADSPLSAQTPHETITDSGRYDFTGLVDSGTGRPSVSEAHSGRYDFTGLVDSGTGRPSEDVQARHTAGAHHDLDEAQHPSAVPAGTCAAGGPPAADDDANATLEAAGEDIAGQPPEKAISLRRNRLAGYVFLVIGLAAALTAYFAHRPLLGWVTFFAVIFAGVAFVVPIDFFEEQPGDDNGDDDNYFEPMMG